MQEPRPNDSRRLPDRIALIAMDFDGVLTDDRVIVREDGTESVICSRADGLGLALLHRAGIRTVILSSEVNRVVEARGRKLGVPVLAGLGVSSKRDVLRRLLTARELDAARVVYVGSDVNDTGCLELAGCAVVPADAHPRVIALADIVLSRPGGRGAVRELAELILNRIPHRDPTQR